MKKIIYLVLTFLLIGLIGCSNHDILSLSKSSASSSSFSSSTKSKKDLNFYIIYSDFIIADRDGKEHDNSIDIFNANNYENWDDFEGKNFKGVTLPALSLYDRTLICLRIYPAKSTMLSQKYIDHIEISDNLLTVYVNQTGVLYLYDLEDQQKYGYSLILATVDASEIPSKIKTEINMG
jgi:hypothetical protein